MNDRIEPAGCLASGPLSNRSVLLLMYPICQLQVELPKMFDTFMFKHVMWNPFVYTVVSAFYGIFFVPLYIKRLLFGTDPSCGPLPLTEEVKAALTDPKWGQHRRIKANGLYFHVVEKGSADKPLVLFLHGFPECWYVWRHQLLALGKTGSVHAVAVDLRGYGETDKPQGYLNYSIDLLCADVAGLIEALGHTEAVVVGDDWGGNIAWHFAHLYPGRVKGLVAMNCPHPRAFAANYSWKQFFKSWYIFFFQCPKLPEIMMSEGGWKFMSAGMVGQPVGVKNREGFTDTDLAVMMYTFSQDTVATNGVNYYRALCIRKPALVKALETPIQAETLFLWGEQDEALGVELMKNTDRYVRKLKSVVIPNCSHWVQVDRPKEVIQAMVEFLEGLGIKGLSGSR